MNQTAIWSYLQNHNEEFFLGASTRATRLLKMAEKRQSAGILLNIGAGNGYLESQAKKAGWNVVSVDPDHSTCTRLVSDGIDARVGVAERLPVDSKSVDVVIATELFEHLSAGSFRDALSEIRRVLTQRGILLGTVPYCENLASSLVICPDCKKAFHRYGHQQSFTPESIRAQLSSHFQVRVCRPELFPPWNILNWKGKVIASLQLLISRMGVHGSSENILFVCNQVNMSGG